MEALFLTLPVVFGLADRGIGGLLRRSYVVGALLLAAVILGLMGFKLEALTIAVWLIYRTIPWKVGGSTTPRSVFEIGASLLRHAMPIVVVPLGHVWFETPLVAALPLAAYAVVATILAVAYAKHVDGLAAQGLADTGEFNDRLEILRGITFGLAAAGMLQT